VCITWDAKLGSFTYRYINKFCREYSSDIDICDEILQSIDVCQSLVTDSAEFRRSEAQDKEIC